MNITIAVGADGAEKIEAKLLEGGGAQSWMLFPVLQGSESIFFKAALNAFFNNTSFRLDPYGPKFARTSFALPVALQSRCLFALTPTYLDITHQPKISDLFWHSLQGTRLMYDRYINFQDAPSSNCYPVEQEKGAPDPFQEIVLYIYAPSNSQVTDIKFVDFTIVLSHIGGMLSLVSASALIARPLIRRAFFQAMAKGV